MDIYRTLLQCVETDQPCALGIVVHALGSTPQKPGSKALLEANGTLHGTLGGGMVEANGINAMREALDKGDATLIDCPLDEDYSREAGPICGGLMQLYALGNPARFADAYRSAIHAQDTRERGVLATRLPGDAEPSVTWHPEDSLDDGALRECLDAEESRCVDVDGDRLFLEPVLAAPRLLIVGGGHVGQATATQATLLGFDVTVLDDREAFTEPALFPAGTTTMCGDVGAIVEAFPKDADTYIVLVSKGHRIDAEALESCIHSDLRYLGMIGSKRKIRMLRKDFVGRGIATDADFDRIVAPIGVDIGALTVAEIGVSIAAQLIAARRSGVPLPDGLVEQW